MFIVYVIIPIIVPELLFTLRHKISVRVLIFNANNNVRKF